MKLSIFKLSAYVSTSILSNMFQKTPTSRMLRRCKWGIVHRNTSNEIHEQAFQHLKRYYTVFGVKRNLEYLDFFIE